MRLKIVGGPRDGHWVDVEPGRDLVVLPDPLPMPQVGVDFASMAPEVLTVSTTIYTVRKICGTDKMFPREKIVPNETRSYAIVRFLAPEKWSDDEAINHQFRK